MGRNARWRLGFSLFYLIVTCLPPLSYAPNVVGLYDIIQGNYTYDPSSPWTNHFAATWQSPDPRPVLAKTLDQLIGKTGLDPLDAAHPLVSYRVERVFPLTDKSGLVAQIEFQYSDHSTRMYRYLVSGREVCRPECGAGGWMYTDLDAFRAEHKALPGLTPVDATSPITLGTPQRLPTPYDAQHFVAPMYLGDAGKLLSTYAATDACWAPDGQSFLLIGNGGGNNDGPVLWHAALNGSSIQRVDGAVSLCAWGSSGKQFAYLRLSHSLAPRTWGLPWFARYEIVTVDTVTQTQTVVGETFNGTFAVARNAIYYLQVDNTLRRPDARLWRKTLDDRPAQEITILANAARTNDQGYDSVLVGAPDGEHFIYRCGTALCLTDVSNGTSVQLPLDSFTNPTRVPFPSPASGSPYQNIAGSFAGILASWSHDGSQVAIASSGTHRGTNDLIPTLWILDKAGQVRFTLPFDPHEGIYAPQWTPDDRFLVGPSFPSGGRRIVGVEVANGQVWDLTQPKWDAYSSLSPDGKQVLLWNGRGGFWTADLLTSPP